jgi:hypothetical protein
MKKLFSLLVTLLLVSQTIFAQGQAKVPASEIILSYKEAASVSNPSANFGSVFVDGGIVKIKLSDGTTKSLLDSVAGGYVSSLTGTANQITVSASTGAITISLPSVIDIATGLRISGSATTGNDLRGNGTNFVSSGLLTSDLSGQVALANGGTGLNGPGTANQVLGVVSGGGSLEYKTITAGSGVSVTHGANSITIAATGGGGGGTLSALTAATGSNDIDSGNNPQVWRWNTLAGITGLQLASNSTAAASNAQTLFDVALSGANANSSQTTIAGRIANTHTGTASTNVALSLSASGATNNYALLIPSGRVGIGTSTPLANVDLGSDATNQKLLIYSNVNTRYGLGQDGSGMRIFGSDSGIISFGTVASSDGSAYTERARLTTSLFDLTGSGQKLAFSGNGGITFGGTGGTAKIDFNTTVDAKSILFYHSSNTQNGIGTASGQQRYFVASGGSIHSFGVLSTGDGTTYTEKASISETALNLSGTSQNLTFTGNGGIVLGGGTSLNSGSKISFGSGVNSQAIAFYVNGNTKHYIGVASGQSIFAHPTGAKTSIGAISTTDGTTFTNYFDFNDNGKLDFIQGTITTSLPFINHTATLNNGSTTFELLKSNITVSAAASASKWINLLVSSTSRFSVDLSGQIVTNNANGIVHNLGYLKVGHFFDAVVGFSGIANAEMTNLNTDYLALQAGDGSSYFNCKSGVEMFFRYGNSDRAKLTSSGTIWDFTGATGGLNSRTSFGAKTSGYTLLTADSGGVFTNGEAVGSVTFSLPAAAAGLHYKFYVTTNQNFVIDAAGSDTIRLTSSVTASGGNLTSSTVGNTIELIYIGTGQWGVLAHEGSWTVN